MDPANPTPTEPPVPTTPTEPSEPATPPAVPPPVDITQTPEFKAALTEGVERVFTERLGRETQKIRRELERKSRAPAPAPEPAPQSTEPTPPAPSNGQGGPDDVTARRLDFYIAASGLPGTLTPNARARMERTWLAESKAGDSAADWITDYVSDMGIGTTPPGTTTAPPPTTPAAQPPAATTTPDPSGPPASDRGGPSTVTDDLAVTDMEKWTDDHMTRFTAEAAEAKQSIGKYVRGKIQESLKGKTLVFPR